VGTGINVESQQKLLELNLQKRFFLVFTNEIKFVRKGKYFEEWPAFNQS
jgi:hypothetical protein